MKMNKLKFLGLFAFIAILSTSCSDDDNNGTKPQTIADIAIAGEDFSILETALTRTNLVATLDGTAQFTVFAPTNGAFDKLPAGTVEGLLKTDKKETLTDILQYHVSVGVYKPEAFKDGQIIGQVNGSNIIVHVKDGKVSINDGATIVASIPASNGIIHVIDGVLLPPATKN